MPKLPKWLLALLPIVSYALNVLGGTGTIPPLVQLRPSTAQPLITIGGSAPTQPVAPPTGK